MSVTSQDVIEIIRDVKPRLAKREIMPDTPLTAEGLDSLDLMNVYFLVEERFQVKLEMNEDEGTAQLLSVQDILDHIRG